MSDEKDIVNRKLALAKDRVSMLEAGMEMKTTSRTVHVTESGDSLEIGAQATGRVKIYGNFKDKKDFAERVNNALELMEASRKKLEKINGGE